MKKLLYALIICLLFSACSSNPVETDFKIPEHAQSKEIVVPEKDVFSGAEILELSEIQSGDIGAIMFHLSEDIDDQNQNYDIAVTERKDIQKIISTFEETQLAVDIMGMNPDTGTQLDMVWYFQDQTKLELYFRNYLSIESNDNTYGTYVFAGEISQNDYVELCHSYLEMD